jgi:hypothetical protein
MCGQILATSAEIEEERRLLYVAMTRAKGSAPGHKAAMSNRLTPDAPLSTLTPLSARSP